MKRASTLAAALLLGSAVQASALTVVNVSAPAVNCVFNPACTITVSDSSGNIPVPGAAGSALLQSRTFTGVAGSPGAGKRGYLYRVDLRYAYGILDIPCVTGLKLAFGPVTALQYNGVGPLDQVYVVTGGGIGSVGLASATQAGNTITFTFASPVCAGGNPGGGQSTYFFGLASTKIPKAITAQVKVLGGAWVNVAARAPAF
jgi:hypothetical protein